MKRYLMAEMTLERLPGISYMVDEESNRIIIVLDKEKYGEAWEDFYDGLISELRKDEPTITIEELKAELKAEGKL